MCEICDWENGTAVVHETGQEFSRVHRPEQCRGRHCIFHNPWTTHPMSQWPLWWRSDRGFFERTCPHGIGHPSPEDVEFWLDGGQEFRAVHGCDGCCNYTWEDKE